jgi:site-specific recombinase XerD
MFDQLFNQPWVVARHASAPYAEERARYLACCIQRGDSRATVSLKAHELLWVARKLSMYPDLRVTIEQLQAVACDWKDREHACGRKIDARWARRRFIDIASAWLRHLGYLHKPVEPIPFQTQLEEYCDWAKNERGLSETTIDYFRRSIEQFLRWYGPLGRPLSDVHVNDVDAYLVHRGDHQWCRVTVQNVACALRAFFRYGAERGWTRPHLARAIQGPRIYALEGLPAGPSWADVERLFAALDSDCPKDVRDRAILMLFAIYGLREREVARLRLDNLDWEHDLLHVARAKRRETQVYPLLPSAGNAIVEYLQKVRHPSAHREVFLTLLSPYRPLSGSGLYWIVASRLRALGVQTAHRGPHCLRHACAARLLAHGLSLKEIGDHLGHRSTSATRIYAKVDLPGLREVAAFDLGELR